LNLESNEVLPVELFPGAEDFPLFPLVFPLASPLVDGDASGVISTASLPMLGRAFGCERCTTVGVLGVRRNERDTFLEISVLGEFGGIGGKISLCEAFEAFEALGIIVSMCWFKWVGFFGFRQGFSYRCLSKSVEQT
jgi:hypothetical protein